MDRRNFIRLCSSGAGMALSGEAALGATYTAKRYARARLLDASGKPLRAVQVSARRNYVFFYPFLGTPCFLLNLGRPATSLRVAGDTGEYTWPGGAGPDRSIVAYSAICSHQLTYPTRDISFISFRPGKAGPNKHSDVIHCCSEHSQYDPSQGARVLAGPAPRPLTAIMLEHDARTDEIHATGTLGPEAFNEFFRKYEFRLAMEHGGRAANDNSNNCRVTELDKYCRQQVQC